MVPSCVGTTLDGVCVNKRRSKGFLPACTCVPYLTTAHPEAELLKYNLKYELVRTYVLDIIHMNTNTHIHMHKHVYKGLHILMCICICITYSLYVKGVSVYILYVYIYTHMISEAQPGLPTSETAQMML